MSKTLAGSISLMFILAVGLNSQTSLPPDALSFDDHAILSLQQVSGELNSAVRRFYTHLDQAIDRHDRGYRSEDGPLVPAADKDLDSGPADLMWSAARRFAAFRMLYARKKGYEPDVLADLDHIQNLVMEARKRVDASVATPRRLLVVSVAELDPHRDSALKAKHNLLLKTRAAAEAAAKRALLALPIEQPPADSPDESAQQVWDSLGRKSAIREEPVRDERVKPIPTRKPELNQVVPPRAPVELPIHLESRKRVTLINEISYRMAMTDSGIEDEQGRHIFYQEEWVQRGAAAIRFRWRVAVETSTGEHVLLKRYPPLELQGILDDLYNRADRDYLWYLEPPDDSTEPTRNEVESALARVARTREAIRLAARDFRRGVHDTLAQQDGVHAAANEPVVDGGLAEGMRQTLFAIRAHLARVPTIIDLERSVRRSIENGEIAVRDLELLAAWANRVPKAGWDLLLDRSDREIDSVRTAVIEALASLPPDSSLAEDTFPAIAKNVIIRIRRAPSRNPTNEAVKCTQEIWWMQNGMSGTREVRRAVSLILIDPRTGIQTRVGVGTTAYNASQGDILEEIFDEYASDEVGLS